MPSSFDFVIVEGGTSGLVVATRLSEIHRFRVLVLEAGGDHNNDPRYRATGMSPSLHGKRIYSSEPPPFSICKRQLTTPKAGLNNRSVTVNQGKEMGGSSAINAQVFVPPTKANFDAWEALGNEGWNWAMLQKIVTRTYTYPSVEEKMEAALGMDEWAAKNEAAKGPIRTSFPKVAVHEAWANTMKALGYSMANDPFVGAMSGSFGNLLSIDPTTKERSCSASAYYQPCKDRGNLVLLTGAYVEKILFDQEGGVKAVGVQYSHDGITKTVSATKEVVLAAGTFQSPKILELSDIGDTQLLTRLGIKPVRDLPGVGENLQDHLACGAMQEYATSKSGALASIGIETYAYLPILDHVSRDSLAWSPDSPASPVQGKLLTIATVLSQPLSPGTSHIRSADPTDAPVIDPAYLSHPVDAEVMAAQMLQIEQIAASEQLSSTFLVQPLQRRDAASDCNGDREKAKRFARTSSTSMWHPTGTCAMLPMNKRGVVDIALRVHGVQGMRVVDASVMPLVYNSNLQAVVYGVAERAADLIKAAWGA
ncbi:L-sorbose 1-dehydrogenase [Cytospora mali]|uniref:L-sorbose 1-dehydrogenase n=1 Tax=Cytospora mali TaxID=578113 RepID=A0A194V8S5_CYTMA|nr:L-sorbose 1-dehydrogenase [Valsa mali var. pyri (nom. inval.)]